MISEKYLEHRYKQGLARGQAQGREQGLAQGREQGLAQGQAEGQAQGHEREKKKWEEWVKRLIESGQLPTDVILPSPDSDRNGKEA